MKIVNRTEFLSLPEGTVFAKYEPCVFGDLSIKGQNAGDNDFFYLSITDSVESHDSSHLFDQLFAAENEGLSVPMDFEWEGRDGLFEGDEIKFAVFEEQDVRALIVRLQETLQ